MPTVQLPLGVDGHAGGQNVRRLPLNSASASSARNGAKRSDTTPEARSSRAVNLSLQSISASCFLPGGGRGGYSVRGCAVCILHEPHHVGHAISQSHLQPVQLEAITKRVT